MSVIKFKPIYQERVWGGRDLEKKLGRSLPTDNPFGESWEVVDRPEAQSVVDGGEFDGKTIRELISGNCADIMGPNWDADKPFPILVKWLDCQDRLSLQVHPPADVAPELGGEPKTECWYIAECTDSAAIMAGLKNGVTREQFEEGLKNNDLEDLCHRIMVNQGDHIFIPSGRIHAIDAGNLILETQQNSDTTYRVYDWGRVGLDGKPREIHIDKSLKSTDFDDFEPTMGNSDTVADCKEFRTRKLNIAKGEKLELEGNKEPHLIAMIQGTLSGDGISISRGDNVLVPYNQGLSLTADEDTVILLSDHFAS